MKTDLNAFDDEHKKKEAFANAKEAEAYYLAQVAKYCSETVAHCQDVTNSINLALDDMSGVKESMLPDLSVN